MITIHQTINPVEALLITPFITSIDVYYPDITEWYINTVIPGVVTGNDILLIAKDKNYIAGILLAKKSEENKLRCVRVAPSHKGSGLGIKLIDQALNLIGDKPLVSVSQELLHDYSRMFVNRYKFILSDVVKGAYRENKLEYFFNQ